MERRRRGASIRPPAGSDANSNRRIQATYPQLGSIEFESFWAGESGFAVHRMPQVGEVMPHVWLASGFGGQGLNTTAIAGELISRAIAENDDTWRVFMPYELVWAGGTLGRAVAQAATWWSHQKEAAAARMAQRREELSLRRRREAGELPAHPARPAYRVVTPSFMRGLPHRRAAVLQEAEKASPAYQPAPQSSDRAPEMAVYHVAPVPIQEVFAAPVDSTYPRKAWSQRDDGMTQSDMAEERGPPPANEEPRVENVGLRPISAPVDQAWSSDRRPPTRAREQLLRRADEGPQPDWEPPGVANL